MTKYIRDIGMFLCMIGIGLLLFRQGISIGEIQAVHKIESQRLEWIHQLRKLNPDVNVPAANPKPQKP